MTLSGESSASSISSSSSATRRKRPVAVEEASNSREMSGTSGPGPGPEAVHSSSQEESPGEDGALLSSSGIDAPPPPSWMARNQWVVYAIASGGCAAFNGVFAKLTTNDLTTHIARGVSGVLGLTASRGIIEVVVRCIFFGLNLTFNGVMWTFFTQALAKGHSTTQVAIMNTSTNFMITALLGLLIFAESLPPLWWLGAAMLVAGNVIVGRKSGGGGGGATNNSSSNKDDEGAEDDGGSRTRLLANTAPNPPNRESNGDDGSRGG